MKKITFFIALMLFVCSSTSTKAQSLDVSQVYAYGTPFQNSYYQVSYWLDGDGHTLHVRWDISYVNYSDSLDLFLNVQEMYPNTNYKFITTYFHIAAGASLSYYETTVDIGYTYKVFVIDAGIDYINPITLEFSEGSGGGSEEGIILDPESSMTLNLTSHKKNSNLQKRVS